MVILQTKASDKDSGPDITSSTLQVVFVLFCFCFVLFFHCGQTGDSSMIVMDLPLHMLLKGEDT